jgi:ribosomal 50S subunit-recycling heat shock protein
MPSKTLRLKVKLDGQEGSSVASLTPPFDVIETFGTKARVPVRGTINGFAFRSSLMPMGGCHFMIVNKTIRAGAKVQAGDVVDVVLERDEEVRTVEAPPELQKELKKSKAARERWEKLAFTHKKEMAKCIRDAKQDENEEAAAGESDGGAEERRE